MVIRKLGGYENVDFKSEFATFEILLFNDWRGGRFRPAYQSGILPGLWNQSLVILCLSLIQGLEYHEEGTPWKRLYKQLLRWSTGCMRDTRSLETELELDKKCYDSYLKSNLFAVLDLV